MLQTVPWLLAELSLFLITAVATHLVMSFAQTLMHYKLGHHPIGGKFFRNHINFHHAYYSKDHLLSRTYLGEEGNNTPFFFIPVFLVGACTYFVLPAAHQCATRLAPTACILPTSSAQTAPIDPRDYQVTGNAL